MKPGPPSQLGTKAPCCEGQLGKVPPMPPTAWGLIRVQRQRRLGPGGIGGSCFPPGSYCLASVLTLIVSPWICANRPPHLPTSGTSHCMRGALERSRRDPSFPLLLRLPQLSTPTSRAQSAAHLGRPPPFLPSCSSPRGPPSPEEGQAPAWWAFRARLQPFP